LSENRTAHGIIDEATRTTLGIEDELLEILAEEVRRARRNRIRREMQRRQREAIQRDDEDIIQIVAALMEAANGIVIEVL
jgi:hypothetical protein